MHRLTRLVFINVLVLCLAGAPALAHAAAPTLDFSRPPVVPNDMESIFADPNVEAAYLAFLACMAGAGAGQIDPCAMEWTDFESATLAAGIVILIMGLVCAGTAGLACILAMAVADKAVIDAFTAGIKYEQCVEQAAIMGARPQ